VRVLVSFIGSYMTDRLLAGGHQVPGLDNFSTGRIKFLATAQQCARFATARAIGGADLVVPLAANADAIPGERRRKSYLYVDSIRWICEHLVLRPAVHYAGGERPWSGDPFSSLDCARIRALGWKPQPTVREAVIRTLESLCRSAL
jgi:nucleoside-diphosphate-sugar epimerase